MMPKRRQWRLSTQILLSQLAVLLVVAVAGGMAAVFLQRQVTVPLWAEILLLAGAAAIVLLLGMLVSLLLARRLNRAMFGLEFEDVTAMLGQVERMAASREALRRVAASRRRIVTAADEARREIERDLHDGAQQRLVTLALQLRQAHDTCPGPPELRDQLRRITQELGSLLEELREISHGVHPAILSQAGLGPALRSLARRAALPVSLRVDVAGRLPEPLEVAAYYVVSEALANAAKHSGASAAEVAVAARETMLDVRISDDGAGGADQAKGSGLVGLRDRVEALGGTMAVASPPGGGTTIRAELPVGAPEGSPAT
jgi:signal transduction histidine kinase